MDFRIADTFTDSLAKLTGTEQKAVKTTAFDLQLNPARPGLRFHRLDGARDPNFWSIRVSRDIRIIVHRTGSSLMLCYVGHHDDAYKWAERRKLETTRKQAPPNWLRCGNAFGKSPYRCTAQRNRQRRPSRYCFRTLPKAICLAMACLRSG